MCANPASTERCTSSATLTSSRKTSTDPASARDISSRSPTMRWKRRRSSLEQLQGALRSGGRLVAVRLEHLEGGRQRGERRPQLVADVGVEARLALDALLQLVDHGVEGDGQALEVGVGRLGVEPGVELAAGDGAGRPRHVGQRAQRARRWRSGPSATPKERGDHAGDEQGEPEHAQRVVEVGEVEHLEVDGLHRGDGHADDDLGRARRSCGRSGWPPSRPARPGAAWSGWTRR